MNFQATNVTIIDYANLNAGFMLEIECNSDNADLTGEVIFDNIR